MKTLNTLLLSLTMLFIGTTLNAQETSAQKKLKQHKELSQKIQKGVRIQKIVKGKQQPGKHAISSSVITIIGPDGKKKTFTFSNPGQSNAFGLEMLGYGTQHPNPEFMIGIELGEIPEGFHELIGIEPNTGVIIKLVMNGKPAEKAGLKKHDLILELNAKKVTSPQQIQEMIKAARDSKLALVIRRGKETLEIAVTPEKTKQPEDRTLKIRVKRTDLDGDGIEDNVIQGIHSFDHRIIGPGMLMQAGSHNKEIEALKQQIKELTKQQAEMKALLESVKELISEQK